MGYLICREGDKLNVAWQAENFAVFFMTNFICCFEVDKFIVQEAIFAHIT